MIKLIESEIELESWLSDEESESRNIKLENWEYLYVG